MSVHRWSDVKRLRLSPGRIAVIRARAWARAVWLLGWEVIVRGPTRYRHVGRL